MKDTDVVSAQARPSQLWKNNRYFDNDCFNQERIVVYWPGTNKTFKPIDRVSDVPWTVKLLTFFEKEGIHHFSTCQSIMWKAVSKLLSVVCVAGAAQGKSLGWILPILNNLCDDSLYGNLHLQTCSSPRVLVLCPGHLEVENIGDLIQSLAGEIGLDLSVVKGNKASKPGNKLEDIVEIVNGCDILLINPTKLVTLLDEKAIRLDYCCHFIIESGDKTLRLNERNIELIMLNWRQSRSGREEDKVWLPDQMLLVTEEWNQYAEDFVTRVMSVKRQPLFVFASLQEAAIFKKVTFSPTFHTNIEEKINRLHVILLNSNERKHVICSSDSIFHQRIELEIGNEDYSVFRIRIDEDIADHGEVINSWKTSKKFRSILLVDDESIISILKIPGVSKSLIHLDVPRDSKKVFSRRFSFMIDHMSSTDNIDPGETHILLSDEDQDSFKSLYSLFTRAAVTLSENVKENLRRNGIIDICSDLVEANTSCSSSCFGRHWFKSADQSDEQPLSGNIRFDVINVLSPVCYNVRLKDSRLDRLHQERLFRIGRYYSNKSNIKSLHWDEIREGIHVVIKSQTVFTRARVVKIRQMTSTVIVHLLDSGLKEEVSIDNVFKLPDCLDVSVYPAASLMVRVLGVSPSNRDPDWSQVCTQIVANYLTPEDTSRLDREEVCRGRVVLQTRNVIWVDRCQLMVKHESLNTWILHFETFSWLTGSGWGVAVPGHAHHVLALAKRAGLRLAQEDVTTEDDADTIEDCDGQVKKVDTFATSWLPLRIPITVTVSEVVSTQEFYLQISSQLSSLVKLEQELDQIGASMSVARADMCTSFSPTSGDLVIVRPYSDETSYYRGRVHLVQDSSLKVFLVDYGRLVDISDDTNMFPCPPDLIWKLPAMAIRCHLSGIVEDPDKIMEAGDKFYQMTKDMDLVGVVDCKTIEGGYKVKLFNTMAVDYDEDIGDTLAKLNLVKADDDPSELLNDGLAENWDEDLVQSPWNFDNDLMLKGIKEDWESFSSLDEMESSTTEKASVQIDTENLEVEVNTRNMGRALPTCFPSGLQEEEEKHVRVKWRQSDKHLFIFLECQTFLDLDPSQLSVQWLNNSLSFKVVEKLIDRKITHKLPVDPLTMFGKINPETVKTAVKYRTVEVIAEKVNPESWLRLGGENWKWIERLLEVPENENNKEKEVTVLSSDKYINPLPEALFEEDELEDEDDQDISDTSSQCSISDNYEESKSVGSDDIGDKADKLYFETDSTIL